MVALLLLFLVGLERLFSVIYVNALFSKFSFFCKRFILWPRIDLSPLWNSPCNLPLSGGWLFIREHGSRTLRLLCIALWRQVSLTKIKQLLVTEGWTLWSQPPKEKHPQREVQFMSEVNLNSSESREAVCLLNIFIEEHFPNHRSN